MVQQSRRYPPGPPAVGRNPFALLKYMMDFRPDPIGFVRRRFETYGDLYSTTFRGTPLYVTRDPELIQEVLVIRGGSFGKPTEGLTAKQLRRFLGNGLVTSNGEFWKKQRRSINPAFVKRRVEALGPIMVERTTDLRERWSTATELEVSSEMNALTLAIVCKALFDHDSSSQSDEVATALEAFRNFSGAPALLPPWLPLPSVKRTNDAVQTIDSIVYRLIEERRQEPEESLEARTDLLSTLLLMTDSGNRMNANQLRDEILTLFLAGHETTSQALTWTWYLLSQNPEAEAKLHRELDDVLAGRAVTPADPLPYTEQVILESMRIFPPVCVIPRVAREDTTIGGYHVPAGAEFICWVYLTHHDSRWFPEPERFIPERFSPEARAKLPKGAYLPFGAGQRQCIGKGFALMEAKLILATLAQRYRLRLVAGHPVEKQIAVTLSPRHGMKMTLIRRDRSASSAGPQVTRSAQAS